MHLRGNSLNATLQDPENGPFSPQDKTAYFWRVSACYKGQWQRSICIPWLWKFHLGFTWQCVFKNENLSIGRKSPQDAHVEAVPSGSGACCTVAPSVAPSPRTALVRKTLPYILICQRTNQFYLFISWFSVIGILEDIIYNFSCNYIWN